MQTLNYAVIVTCREQLGYTFPYPAKSDCILA